MNITINGMGIYGLVLVVFNVFIILVAPNPFAIIGLFLGLILFAAGTKPSN